MLLEALGWLWLAQATAPVVLPVTEFNFGQVAAGEQLEVRFPVYNRREIDLVAQGVTGCPCLQIAPSRIPQNSWGEIVLRLDTQGYEGLYSWSREVRILPLDTRVQLQARGIVHRFRVAPQALKLPDGFEPRSLEIEWIEPFQILKCSATLASLSLDCETGALRRRHRATIRETSFLKEVKNRSGEIYVEVQARTDRPGIVLKIPVLRLQ